MKGEKKESTKFEFSRYGRYDETHGTSGYSGGHKISETLDSCAKIDSLKNIGTCILRRRAKKEKKNARAFIALVVYKTRAQKNGSIVYRILGRASREGRKSLNWLFRVIWRFERRKLQRTYIRVYDWRRENGLRRDVRDVAREEKKKHSLTRQNNHRRNAAVLIIIGRYYGIKYERRFRRIYHFVEINTSENAPSN